MGRVAVVDYGLNNLDSVCRAVEECGAEPFVVDGPSQLSRADRIVLPGVGAFPDAMANLAARDLIGALTHEVLGNDVPLLGICLGMQLLATKGYEVRPSEGLGFVPADVVRLVATDADRRIPHVGWNEVHAAPGADCPLLEGIAPGADFYFVHSYVVVPDSVAHTAATTPYCGGFTSIVQHGNVFGVQFHPEKSQTYGFRLLKNFLEW